MGSVQKIDFVWELTDLFNGLMVIPNIIGLFILLKEAKIIYDDFEKQSKLGNKLSYNYEHKN